MAENPARPISTTDASDAAGEENVGIAKFDDSPGFADGIVCCRAGGNDTHVGTVQAELHRDEAARHVAEQHWNRERRSPGGSLGQKDC